MKIHRHMVKKHGDIYVMKTDPRMTEKLCQFAARVGAAYEIPADTDAMFSSRRPYYTIEYEKYPQKELYHQMDANRFNEKHWYWLHTNLLTHPSFPESDALGVVHCYLRFIHVNVPNIPIDEHIPDGTISYLPLWDDDDKLIAVLFDRYVRKYETNAWTEIADVGNLDVILREHARDIRGRLFCNDIEDTT